MLRPSLIEFNQPVSNFKSKIARLEKNISTPSPSGREKSLGNDFLSLGSIYLRFGDYKNSRERIEQAFIIFQEIEFLQGQTWANLLFSVLYHQIDDDEAALEYGRSALRITQELGDHATHAQALIFQGHALVRMSQYAAAHGAYDYALILLDELALPGIRLDALAGLARLAFVVEDHNNALALVEKILSRAQIESIDRSFEPVRILHTCASILEACHDARADGIVVTTFDWLMERTRRLEKPDYQRCYLENIAAHRIFLQAWTEHTHPEVSVD